MQNPRVSQLLRIHANLESNALPITCIETIFSKYVSSLRTLYIGQDTHTHTHMGTLYALYGRSVGVSQLGYLSAPNTSLIFVLYKDMGLSLEVSSVTTDQELCYSVVRIHEKRGKGEGESERRVCIGLYLLLPYGTYAFKLPDDHTWNL